MKQFVRYKRVFFLCMLFSFLLLQGCDYAPAYMEQELSTQTANASEEENTEQKTEEGADVYVHICGNVNKPGLYILPAGSRVDAAVKAAGGFLPGAMESSVNLAQIVEDGSQIYIPSEEEAWEETTEMVLQKIPSMGQEKTDLLNINTATKEELTSLPGIGEGKAGAIVEYRETQGPFQTVDDIKNVSGIGDGTYEKIKDAITI